MEYQNITNEFLKRFAVFKPFVKDEFLDIGPYAVFPEIHQKIIELLKQPNEKNILKKIFDFFEELALSDDERSKEFLMYGALEIFGDDPDILREAENYMGPKTKELSDLVQNFWGR